MKVLYIYSCGEFPTRKTVETFIYSFERYSEHQIFYHNLAMCPLPRWYQSIDFDLVVYSHFVTTPWKRNRYLKKIESLKRHPFTGAKKIAFFQDEYFNTDLTNKFILELGIDKVYSVAPQSEWPKLYGEALAANVQINGCLTGYVDDNDVALFEAKATSQKRSIDIGYRIGWPSSQIFRLGKFGYQKHEIAEQFLKFKPSALKLDIKMGHNLFTGSKWYDFLANCRYTIGCESGSSLLDRSGEISRKINRYTAFDPKATYDEIALSCFFNLDGNLDLRAISPRVFEAALLKTGLILIEGDYSGVLEPNKHYIPVKSDFSNLSDVFEKAKDEKFRLEMVENTYRDLIQSDRYRYSTFIKKFFSDLETDVPSAISENLWPYKKMNGAIEVGTWGLAGAFGLFNRLRQ